MEELSELREQLKRAQVIIGIEVDAIALNSLSLASGGDWVPRPFVALCVTGQLGATAYEVMHAHNTGQEVAARAAAHQTTSQE